MRKSAHKNKQKAHNMGRLTEVFATVADGFQDKHRYSYIKPTRRSTRKVIMEMQHRKAELDKLIKIQASEMKNENLCRMCGD